MQDFFPALENCALVAGISPADRGTMLSCLSPRRKSYTKGETVFFAGEAVRSVGIVLTGSVLIAEEDYWGNRSILAAAGPGELFAESFVCAGIKELPVSVTANEESEILLIDYARIIRSCGNACVFHAGLIENMLRIVAAKNVALTEKTRHLTRRTTQEKLLSYLSEQARRQGKSAFDIPFNRQELADYLAVERSAMSYELARLKKKGLLDYRKNHFEVRR